MRRIAILATMLVAAVSWGGCEAPQSKPLEPVVQLAHTAAIQIGRFSPDGRWLLTAGHDGRVIQWDADDGSIVRSFAAFDFEISPDGKSILVLDQQRGVRPIPTLVSLDTGRVLQRVEGIVGSPAFHTASLTTDGSYLVLVGSGNDDLSLADMVWLWDCRTGKIVWSPGMPLALESPTEKQATPPAKANPDERPQERRSVLFCRSVRPDGRVLATQSPIGAVSFAPDGRHMLTRYCDDTGSATDVTRLWEVESGKSLATFFEPEAHPQPFCYSPDGKRFVRGIGNNTAALCAVATGKTLRTLEGHTGRITSLAYAPDGTTVLTGSEDGSAILWDAATGRQRRKLSVPGGANSVMYGPGGNQAICGADIGIAVLYDLPSGSVVRRYDESLGVAARRDVTATMAPNGKRVVVLNDVLSRKGSALWDAETADAIRCLCTGGLEPVAVSPDGGWTLAARHPGEGDDADLLLWNLATAKAVHRFDWRLAGQRHVRWEHAAPWPRATGNLELQGWQEETGGIPLPRRPALPPAFRSVAPTLGLSAATTRWLEEYILPESARWPRLAGPNDDRIVSSDGSRGATWTVDPRRESRVLAIHDMQKRSVLWERLLPDDSDIRAAFSPDATRILVVVRSRGHRQAEGTTVGLWDIAAGRPLWSRDHLFGSRDAAIEQIVFSPDGRYVVLATSWFDAAGAINAQTGELLLKTEGRPAFGPHGKHVLFLGDNSVLWNLESRTVVHDFGRQTIHRLAFSPSGRTLWVNGPPTGLYSTATGELLQETGELISTFNDKTFGLKGTRFVTRADRRFQTTLWDFETGKRVAELVVPGGGVVRDFAFTPDDRKLLTLVTHSIPAVPAAIGSRKAAHSPCRFQGGLIVWDAATGRRLSYAMADGGLTWTGSNPLRLLPDGEHCLTTHWNGVGLWHIASGLPVHVFRESRGLASVDLALDGRSMLVVAQGQGATVWDLKTHAKIRSFGPLCYLGDAQPSAFWHANSRLSADGRRIISSSHGGRGIHQVDVATGQLIGSFYVLGDGSDAATFTPDGRCAATSPAMIRYRRPESNVLLPLDDSK